MPEWQKQYRQALAGCRQRELLNKIGLAEFALFAHLQELDCAHTQQRDVAKLDYAIRALKSLRLDSEPYEPALLHTRGPQ